MGWFFGCFGRRNKNPPEQKNGAQKPPQPLPEPVPFPTPSIPIISSNRTEQANDAFVQNKQISCSAPVKTVHGFLFGSNANAAISPKRSPKRTDPWSQIDELEEELDDLRRQIEKETHDSDRFTEEVTFLKSCGTLLQTPSELKRKKKTSDMQDISTSNTATSPTSNAWHSWFMPLQTPASKYPLDKRHAIKGLQVASSTSTPANKSQGIVHRKKALDLNDTRSENHVHPVCAVSSAETLTTLTQIQCVPDTLVAESSKECIVDSADVSPVVLATPSRSVVSALSMVLSSQQLNSTEVISPVQKNNNVSSDNVTNENNLPSVKVDSSAEEIVADSQPKDILTDISSLKSESYVCGRFEDSISEIESSVPTVDSNRDVLNEVSISEGNKTDIIAAPKSPMRKHRYEAADSADSNSHLHFGSSSLSINSGFSCGSPSGSSSSMYYGATSNSFSLEGASPGDVTSSKMIDDGHYVSVDNMPLERRSPYVTVAMVSSASVDSPSTSAIDMKTFMHESEEVAENDVPSEPVNVYENCPTPTFFPCVRPVHSPAVVFTRSGIQDSIATPKVIPAKPSRVRSTPTSPVLTPVENVFQWKQLKERELSVSLSPVRTSVKSSAKRQILGSIDNNDGSFRRVSGFITNESCKENLEDNKLSLRTPEFDKVLINTSLSQWIRPKETNVENTPRSNLRVTFNIPESHIAKTMPSVCETPTVPVDVSLSHWLTPSCNRPDLATPSLKSSFSRPLQQTPLLPGDRPILCGIAASGETPDVKVDWDGMGIPNTTTKYKEDQKVNYHSTPFEARLERELDKQQIVSQKSLFGVTAKGPGI